VCFAFPSEIGAHLEIPARRPQLSELWICALTTESHPYLSSSI